MNVTQISITLTTLLGVLISYILVFSRGRTAGGYIKHPLWLGMETSLVKFIVGLQLIAAVGFVAALYQWIRKPPSKGILGHTNALFITLMIFSIAAIGWPWAVLYKQHFLVVLSLCLTAISSIILLAGSVEDDQGGTPWWVTVGLLFLSLVTVLADGVLWNAKYIISWKNNTLPEI